MDTPLAMPARTTAPSLAPGLRVACWLSVAMLPLLVLATGAGLLAPAVYERNPATIIPALRGQDLVTLLALLVFGLALCFTLLRSTTAPRPALLVAVLLAVVPHSLNHLPDLFLVQPVSGLILLLATSLLFGLPMALLQLRRNLETAISFHWFIDAARFLFGY